MVDPVRIRSAWLKRVHIDVYVVLAIALAQALSSIRAVDRG